MQNNEGQTVKDKNVLGYELKMFQVIPEGQKLVCLNKLTGKIIVKSSGFKFMWPWIVSKKSNDYAQPLNTPATSTLANDNIRITYDTDYLYKIVDQETFAKRELAQQQASNIDMTLQDIIGRELDQIVKNYIKSVASTSFINNSTVDILKEFDAKAVLASIKNEYGIEITKLYITDIGLPKSITDAAEIAKRDEAVRRNELENSKNRAQVAKTDAQAERIRLEAKIKALLTTKAAPEVIAQTLQTEALANGTSQNIILGALGSAMKTSDGSQSTMIPEIIAALKAAGFGANTSGPTSKVNFLDSTNTVENAVIINDSDIIDANGIAILSAEKTKEVSDRFGFGAPVGSCYKLEDISEYVTLQTQNVR